MNQKMELAAKKINIKGHYVGLKDEPKFIYGPTDIGIFFNLFFNKSHSFFFFNLEGHIGADNRYYVLDFQVEEIFFILIFLIFLFPNRELFHQNIQLKVNQKELFSLIYFELNLFLNTQNLYHQLIE